MLSPEHHGPSATVNIEHHKYPEWISSEPGRTVYQEIYFCGWGLRRKPKAHVNMQPGRFAPSAHMANVAFTCAV